MAQRRGQGGWSPTGAARAAREYKTAVIDFLDRSPTPVRVQANTMRSSYRALLKVYHDPHKAAGRVLQRNGVWFQAPPSVDWPAHAREVIAREVEVLRSAPLYVMSPQMCDVTVAAAQTLTMSELSLLDEADPPTGQGFLLLPHPVVSDDGTGRLHMRALGWSVEPGVYPDNTAFDGVGFKMHVRISTYLDVRGLGDDIRDDLAAEAHADRRTLPAIMLRFVTTLPFHARVPAPHEHERMARALHATAAEEARQVLGEDAADARAEYAPGSVLPDPEHNFHSRMTYAFFRLAEQRIATSEQAPVTHSARVLAERAQTTPDVRIIQLRAKTKQSEAEGGHRSVDWSHRWVVQMHKVRQWYPSEQRNKIILRGPYVKGPADKPLIGGEVVRALIR